MTIVKVTSPAGYPVTLTEAKDHCRVTSSAHDTRITAYIAAATALVEKLTEMLLVEQTVRLELDGFPDDVIDIPVAPLQGVISLKYDDLSNVEQTLTLDTHFYARASGRYPIIQPAGTWPTTCANKPGSVRITLLAGYDTANSPIDYGENIPADLRHAILIKVKEFFDNGGETIVGNNTVSPSANTVLSLTEQYKRWNSL